MYWRKGVGGRATYIALLLRDAVPQGLGARIERLLSPGEPQAAVGGGPQGSFLDRSWLDLRFAFRVLRRSPGFSLVTIITLAVGIGANVAIFSLVNGVLLTSLPYPAPERVVALLAVGERGQTSNASVPDVEDIRARASSLEAISQVQFTSATLLGDNPVRLEMLNVGPGFFDVFRVEAELGRTFAPDEHRVGQAPVVVLSHGFWQTVLGGDLDVVGAVLTLDGWDGFEDTQLLQPVVVGVMPREFADPYRADTALWMTQPGRYGRGTRIYQAVARVDDDHTLDDARAELAIVGATLADAYPDTNGGMSMTVTPANELQIADTRRPLLVFMGAVGLLLLVACLNVANLLLSRAQSRGSEFAVRRALGAGRGRIASQLLIESLLLSSLGGLLGVALAVVGLDVLLAMVGDALPAGRNVSIDQTVLLFALALAGGTGLMFGVGPSLKTGGEGTERVASRGSEGRARRTVRSTLVVLEMATAVILLAGAGLLIKSFINVVNEEPGFATENVLAFRVAPSSTRHPDREDVTRLYENLTDRIESLPEVTAVASSNFVPVVGGGWANGFSFDDNPEDRFSAEVRAVTPDYFTALSIPVVEGRGFERRDVEGTTEVAVVNEAFVRQFIPDGEPLGKRVTMNDPSRVIVGVVADTRFRGLESPAGAEFFTPHAQQSQWWLRRFQWIVVRTVGEPTTAFPRVRDMVREVDPTLPITRVTTMHAIIGESVTGPRVVGVLVSVFAIVALILAGVGVAGVMAYNVTTRAPDFAVRVALGARPAALLNGVLLEGLRLTFLGGLFGITGALALGGVLSSLLYDVSAKDPLTFLGVAGVLGGVALLASYFPARRILRIDPVRSLRGE